MIKHGVAYPAEYGEIDPRFLLKFSQTNITKNPQNGLQFGAAAYGQGLEPQIEVSDPTLAGEAARQCGFRAEQAGQTAQVVDTWFEESLDLLAGPSDRSRRERLATRFMRLRAWGLRQLNGGAAKQGLVIDEEVGAIEREIEATHTNGEPWDRYAAMGFKILAAYEAIRLDGRAVDAQALAIRGLHASVRAKNEVPKEASNKERAAGLAKHSYFVIKQAAGNASALGLAASRPWDSLPVVHAARHRLALKILG